VDGTAAPAVAAVPAAAAAAAGEHPPALGPQLPGNAMDQTDIDKLLASFD